MHLSGLVQFCTLVALVGTPGVVARPYSLEERSKPAAANNKRAEPWFASSRQARWALPLPPHIDDLYGLHRDAAVAPTGATASVPKPTGLVNKRDVNLAPTGTATKPKPTGYLAKRQANLAPTGTATKPKPTGIFAKREVNLAPTGTATSPKPTGFVEKREVYAPTGTGTGKWTAPEPTNGVNWKWPQPRQPAQL